LTGNRLQAVESRVSERNGEFTAALSDCLAGFTVVKNFRAEREIFRLFAQSNNNKQNNCTGRHAAALHRKVHACDKHSELSKNPRDRADHSDERFNSPSREFFTLKGFVALRKQAKDPARGVKRSTGLNTGFGLKTSLLHMNRGRRCCTE